MICDTPSNSRGGEWLWEKNGSITPALQGVEHLPEARVKFPTYHEEVPIPRVSKFHG